MRLEIEIVHSFDTLEMYATYVSTLQSLVLTRNYSETIIGRTCIMSLLRNFKPEFHEKLAAINFHNNDV